MKRNRICKFDEGRPAAKKIRVVWPVLCKVELEDVMNKLDTILKRVNYPNDKDVDVLVSAMKSFISAGKRALEELEHAYGE